MKRISIIVPLFNESEALEQLYSEIVEEIDQLPYSFEIIFVDDGSSDGSLEILRPLLVTDSRIRLIAWAIPPAALM